MKCEIRNYFHWHINCKVLLCPYSKFRTEDNRSHDVRRLNYYRIEFYCPFQSFTSFLESTSMKVLFKVLIFSSHTTYCSGCTGCTSIHYLSLILCRVGGAFSAHTGQEVGYIMDKSWLHKYIQTSNCFCIHHGGMQYNTGFHSSNFMIYSCVLHILARIYIYIFFIKTWLQGFQGCKFFKITTKLWRTWV